MKQITQYHWSTKLLVCLLFVISCCLTCSSKPSAIGNLADNGIYNSNGDLLLFEKPWVEQCYRPSDPGADTFIWILHWDNGKRSDNWDYKKIEKEVKVTTRYPTPDELERWFNSLQRIKTPKIGLDGRFDLSGATIVGMGPGGMTVKKVIDPAKYNFYICKNDPDKKKIPLARGKYFTSDPNTSFYISQPYDEDMSNINFSNNLIEKEYEGELRPYGYVIRVATVPRWQVRVFQDEINSYYRYQEYIKQKRIDEEMLTKNLKAFFDSVPIMIKKLKPFYFSQSSNDYHSEILVGKNKTYKEFQNWFESRMKSFEGKNSNAYKFEIEYNYSEYGDKRPVYDRFGKPYTYWKSKVWKVDDRISKDRLETLLKTLDRKMKESVLEELAEDGINLKNRELVNEWDYDPVMQKFKRDMSVTLYPSLCLKDKDKDTYCIKRGRKFQGENTSLYIPLLYNLEDSKKYIPIYTIRY